MADNVPIQGIEFEIRGSADQAAQSLLNFAEKIRELDKVGDSSEKLGRIAKGIKAVKEAASGKMPNIQKLAEHLDLLYTAVGVNEDSFGALAKTASALERLSKIQNINIPKNIGDGIRNIGLAAENISSVSVDAVDRLTRSLQRLSNVSSERLEAFSKLRIPKIPLESGFGIQNMATAIEQLSDEALARLERFASIMGRMKDVDFSGLASFSKINVGGKPSGDAEKARGLGQSVLSAIGSRVKNHYINIGKAAQYLAKQAFNAAQTVGKKLASALITTANAAARFAKRLIAAPFQRVATNATNLKKKLDNLGSSFARIMFYRAIRQVIKEISEALKEGETNAYWYSKQFGESTRYISEAYDTFASASAKMKNQIGAAWATLFANLQPIINKIIELVSRAAEVVTMFFAKLGGKSTYLKAIDYSKDWAEATEKGAKAAKEWKNQLLGFDVINRLEDTADTSNSNSDLNTPNYGDMFEEVPVESAIGDLADRMRELWQAQDWESLGRLIGNTLNDLFPSREQWQEWGSYLGNGIDGLIQTAYYALKTIDFSEWGSRIADGLNAAIDEIDFYTAGELFTRKVTAMLDFISGFLGSLEWHDIGQAIGDFFRGALDEGTSWLNDHDFGDIAQRFWDSIKEAIMGFDIPSFAQSLGSFLITAMNSIADFVSNTPWDDVVNTVLSSIETFARNVSQNGRLFAAFNNLKDSLISAFELAVTTFGNWVGTKDWYDIGSSFMGALTRLLADLGRIASAIPWTTLANALIEFLSGALDSFTTWLTNKDFADLGEQFNAKLTTALSKIKIEDLTSSLSSALSTTLVKLGDWINGSDPGDITAKLGDFFVRAIEGIDINQLLISFTYMATSFLMNVPEIILGILESEFHLKATAFRQLGMTTVADYLDGIGNKIGNARQDLKTNFTDPIMENVAELLGTNNAPGAGQLGQVGVKSGNDFIEGFGTTINGNNGGSHHSGTFAEMGETVAESFGAGIDSKLPDIHSRVKNAVDETSNTVAEGLSQVAQTSEHEWQRYSYAADSNLKLVTDTAETNTSQLAQTMEANLNGIQESASTSFAGVKDAVTGATGDITNESTEDTQTLYNDVTGIYNDLHSEAVRVFSDIGRAVPQIMNYMAQEVQNSVRQMEQSFTNMQYTVSAAFDTIRANIESAIYAIESLDWSIPAPHLPHITWYYDTVYSDDGSSFNIPQFDVQWYAKGGIVDGATLFGAGEAGREAIIPLERNTEWISKVAQELNNQQLMSGYRDESNDDVIDALYTICDRIIRAMPDGGDDVDMDSLARALSKVQRRQARAMG